MNLIKNTLFGKKVYQSFFRRLFTISLEGMNIGTGGGNLSHSGEKFVISHILRGEPKPIVFDVGAQGGDYLTEVLRVTEDRAEVYAFEPSKLEYEKLVKDFKSRAHVFNSALGNSEGELTLFSPKDKSGLSSFHRKDSEFDRTEKVKVTTIDQFCRLNDIKAIHLLKLDVEGHELACLEGAKNMLPYIKYIQFEMSVASRDARVYFKDIFETLSDYKISRILRDGLEEVKSPDRLSELLFTTNYLAERR